jgi:hypothetical protein
MLHWALIFCFLESTDDWAQHYPNRWLDGKNCTHKAYTWFVLNPMYPLFARFQLGGVYAGDRWIQKRFPDFHHGEWWSKISLLDKCKYRVFSSAVLFMGSNNQILSHIQFSQKYFTWFFKSVEAISITVFSHIIAAATILFWIHLFNYRISANSFRPWIVSSLE